MTYFSLPEIPNYNKDIYGFINPLYKSLDNFNKIVMNKTLAAYLLNIKSEIDTKQNEWDKYKKYINPYEYIHTTYPSIKSSICKLKPTSRAFYKFIEIYHTLGLHEILKNKIKIFFLAEGPGGFIEATNYIRKDNDDIYHAITLLDDNDVGIPGWKKKLNLTKNIVYENGVDNTGDIFNIETYNHFYDRYAGTMDLITADGGFNFSSDFNNQENISTKLLLFEIFYAIMLQKQGGVFIIKFYDTFSQISVDMIYFLMLVYKSVVEIKPCSSRYANSEKYIVCKNYRLDNFNKDVFLDIMLKIKTNNIERLFSINIPYYISNKIEEYNAIFGQQQLENILNTLSIMSNNKHDKFEIIKKQNISKCINWCIRYKLPFYNIEQNTFNNTTNNINNKTKI